MPDVKCGFFFVVHLHQLLPFLGAADVIRQHYPVVKRQFFFAENGNLVGLVYLTVGPYKTVGTGACPNHYNTLKVFFVFFYTYCTVFEIRFFGYRIDDVAGDVIGSVKVAAQDFAPMHRKKYHTLLNRR
ncbi:hypothetical protein D3C86_1601050 [compost metagenome]